MVDLSDVNRAAAARGLCVLGAFQPNAQDDVPALEGGNLPGTVVMIGNAGSALWQHFAPHADAVGEDHPLDVWTRAQVLALAKPFDAVALFPFDGPPFYPFQRWAERAAPASPSPLGLFIHREYGLWFALRAALLLENSEQSLDGHREESPCVVCVEQPCLKRCPVGAFTGNGYEVDRCAQFVATEAGRVCGESGCQARLACPIGVPHQYEKAHMQFHMRQFLISRLKA